MTLSAVVCNREVADGIGTHFMHGPTFMANPLACAVALASIRLLLSSNWQQKVRDIESQLKTELAVMSQYDVVKDVRVLGAIGVVEVHEPLDWAVFQEHMIDSGVWIRPFMNLIYMMPPFIIEPAQLTHITQSLSQTIKKMT